MSSSLKGSTKRFGGLQVGATKFAMDHFVVARSAGLREMQDEPVGLSLHVAQQAPVGHRSVRIANFLRIEVYCPACRVSKFATGVAEICALPIFISSLRFVSGLPTILGQGEIGMAAHRILKEPFGTKLPCVFPTPIATLTRSGGPPRR